MSIAVLNQVYDEARRLAVAGSVVAKGDFRLKKLVAPLEQAGTKAPVFAKVAEAANKVIDGPEDSSAESLLDLTSLVTAVLYTQGETGIAGELKAIETVNLVGESAQTSARLLKPLLEALSSTGSGRLELVKDAHDRGAFRDLRLVKPALDGLDDPYSEIADFLAEKVLPVYCQAILPELRRVYDPKGTKGHPRRLKSMHAIDPAGTRELVKQALEGGSKEVKVAAISCLGAEAEDLQLLIEQAGARAQDVRGAAYRALAMIDDPAAVAVLQKAFGDRDVELAARAIGESRTEGLSAVLVAEIRNASTEFPKLKDRRQVGGLANRLVHLIRALPAKNYPASDALLLDLFARRLELAKAKGDNVSGADVVETLIARMLGGTKPLQAVLARAHAELDAAHLDDALLAARRSLPADET
jgi:HEAT repeats